MAGTRSRRMRERKAAARRKALIILVFIILAVLIIYMLVRNKQQTLPVDFRYDIQEQNGAEALSEFSQQTAEAFASGLVTVDGDLDVPELSLRQEDCKALLFDLENTEAVYAHNIYQKVYPASLAKMMTAIIAMENSGMNEIVTMEEGDFLLDEGAQVSSLQIGDTVSMDKLFHLLVIYSANDAAMAIARTVAGSTEAFVELMNQRAQELGMTGTHFTNPTGLHDENMYTTAYDVYLMMRQAYSYQDYLNVSQMAEYKTDVIAADGTSRTIYHNSTDQYLTNERTLPPDIRILASKTGTTDQAGSCLALVVQNEYGVPYVAIVMGCWNKDNLYGNMTAVLELT